MIGFVGISPFLRIALRVAMETMHFLYFARLKIDQTLVFKLSECYSGRGYEWNLCYSPTTYDHFLMAGASTIKPIDNKVSDILSDKSLGGLT